MHTKTRYTPTTTHPTASHNPSLHTTNTNRIFVKPYLCKWWQNGTRCRDGVKVLWCHSHLVWLVFEASIPTCTCFHEGKTCTTIQAITVNGTLFKGVIYSKRCYSSDFFDPQSSLLSVLQSQACTHTKQESLETICI